MRKIKINIPTALTPPELFFVEKSLELLAEESIDTYRLRLHNPHSVLVELCFLIQSYLDQNIAEDYPKHVCEEAKDLLNLDQELLFTKISKNYFQALLSNRDLVKVLYAANLILLENKNYLEKLFVSISGEIHRLNAKDPLYPSDLKRLNYLTSFLYVELRKKGFNKTYLHRTVRAVFSGNLLGNNFADRFSILKAIAERPKEVFTVYFIFYVKGKSYRYLDKNPIRIQFCSSRALTEKAEALKNPHFTEFIAQKGTGLIYSTEIQAIDYYSASVEARKVLQQCLDFSFLGNEQEVLEYSPNCFVLGTNQPSKSKTQSFNYKLDGDLRGNFKTFSFFTRSFRQVSTKNIEPACLDKIKSGLRYLRVGNQSLSPEQKLINYWIAIEYIFSSYEGSSNKTTRLKEFFKKIHAYSYTRRLFLDMHQSILNLGLNTAVTHFHVTDLSYIQLEATETDLFAHFADTPLLNYRLFTLRERFKDHKTVSAELNRHMNNLERNIMRIYRVRNQIVHNAASDIDTDDINELAIHLKYYLVFIINGLLDFLLNHPVDVNGNKAIGIDDYFQMISLQLDGILFDKSYDISKLHEIKNPVEYLRS